MSKTVCAAAYEREQEAEVYVGADDLSWQQHSEREQRGGTEHVFTG